MIAVDATSRNVADHYAKPDLGAVILAALRSAGKDLDHLKLEDLELVDEFHVRRREATRELARAAGLAPGMHVLDVGCGIGGAARTLAHEFGARVTGVDLTAAYCEAATLLSQRVGLADRVSFRQANALDLPYADACFDVVWTQHAAMNIEDKRRLYAECFRVLKQGGALALYDILAGAGGPVHFPVPWAATPQTSFLASAGELRALLEHAGFAIVHWQDRTSAAREWFARMASKLQQGGLPAVGVHLLVGGADYPAMARNQVRNLEEGRIALVELVARRNA